MIFLADVKDCCDTATDHWYIWGDISTKKSRSRNLYDLLLICHNSFRFVLIIAFEICIDQSDRKWRESKKSRWDGQLYQIGVDVMIRWNSIIKINTQRLRELSQAQVTALEKTEEALQTEVVQAQVMPFDTGNLQNDNTFVDYT